MQTTDVLRDMYREQVLEIEAIRRQALNVQMALIAVLAQCDGSVLVEPETMEEVMRGDFTGWQSTPESDGSVLLTLAYQEDADGEE